MKRLILTLFLLLLAIPLWGQTRIISGIITTDTSKALHLRAGRDSVIVDSAAYFSSYATFNDSVYIAGGVRLKQTVYFGLPDSTQGLLKFYHNDNSYFASLSSEPMLGNRSFVIVDGGTAIETLATRGYVQSVTTSIDSGNFAKLSGINSFTNLNTFKALSVGAGAAKAQITFQDTATTNTGTLEPRTINDARTWILQDKSYTIADSSDVATVSASVTALSNSLNVSGFFGDGSDGDSTVSGLITLTRDMFFEDLTITAGGQITTGGFRLFVSDTLNNDGIIHNDGGIGSNGLGGAAGGAGGAGGDTARGLVTITSLGDMGAGGGGSNAQSTAGQNGLSVPSVNYGLASTVCDSGGRGGHGGIGQGTDSGWAGGIPSVGGSTTALPANAQIPRHINDYLRGRFLYGTGSFEVFRLGASGSGGTAGGHGGNGSLSAGGMAGGGGGSGGNGGYVVVGAHTIIGTGTIRSEGGRGGNGGDGAVGSGSAPIGGGGGGGGGCGGRGGILVVVYHVLSDSVSLSANGGEGGVGGAGGAGANGGTAGEAGQNGPDGNSGLLILSKM